MTFNFPTHRDADYCHQCGRLRTEWYGESYHCWWCKDRAAAFQEVPP